MTFLLILSCSAAKAPAGILVPALERYDGPAWRVLRGALRARPGLADRLTVLALSARYGLIPAETEIRYYDDRMTPARAAEIAPAAARLIRERYAGPWGAALLIAGADYRLALPDPLPWPATWASGRPGERLKQERDWLWSL